MTRVNWSLLKLITVWVFGVGIKWIFSMALCFQYINNLMNNYNNVKKYTNSCTWAVLSNMGDEKKPPFLALKMVKNRVIWTPLAGPSWSQLTSWSTGPAFFGSLKQQQLPSREWIHIPPNGKFGNSSTQNCRLERDMLGNPAGYRTKKTAEKWWNWEDDESFLENGGAFLFAGR